MSTVYKAMTGDWIVKYRNKRGQMMDEKFATEEEAWAFAAGRGVNDIALAKRIAARMAKNASASSTRNIHFSVIDDRKPTPFLTHWRHKNTSGVSYPRQETAAAEAWIATALLAGYTVFWHQRKRMWGAGRSLKSGDYPRI